MCRWFTGLALILAACLPLNSTQAWFMPSGLASQCAFKTFTTGTGGTSGAWINIAMSSDGTYMTTGDNSGHSKLAVSTDGGATWALKGTSVAYQRVAMSSDGSKQIAAGSSLYTSTDYGSTWTARNSARSWIGTGISDDGTKMIASVYGGNMYVSTDSGVTFTARDSTRNWSGSCMSADGTKAATVVSGGNIYISTNIASGGTTWTARGPAQKWWTVQCSADFTTLFAITDGGAVYRSTDSGTTWSTVDDLGNDAWRGVAVSADGQTVVVASGGAATGRVYRSTDGGNTWVWLRSLADANYLGIGLSGDGQTMGVTYSSGTPVTEECSYTDKFNGSATDPTAQTFSCGGTTFGGFCWYKGALNQSCDTVCSGHGSCDTAGTVNYTGSAGNSANCQAVMGAVDSTTYGSATTGTAAVGCATDSGSTLYYTTATTTCAAALSTRRRLCSCTQ